LRLGDNDEAGDFAVEAGLILAKELGGGGVSVRIEAEEDFVKAGVVCCDGGGLAESFEGGGSAEGFRGVSESLHHFGSDLSEGGVGICGNSLAEPGESGVGEGRGEDGSFVGVGRDVLSVEEVVELEEEFLDGDVVAVESGSLVVGEVAGLLLQKALFKFLIALGEGVDAGCEFRVHGGIGVAAGGRHEVCAGGGG
jgi:hypothetical protein